MQIKKTEPAVAEVDMTPMIDIVFQLIAFFMVVTNFEQTQADERVKLPKDELAKPPEVKVENKLTLNIGFERSAEGEIQSGPFVFYTSEEIPVENFGQKLQQEARLAEQKGDDPSEMTVVLRADKQVPTGKVQELIRMAQEHGFEKFALKATQEVK